jgi:cellobiose phosphorylase
MTCFVPLKSDCEIHKLTLENKSDRKRSIRVFGAVEWCLWNALDDAINFQRNLNIGEVEVEGRAIYHKTEYASGAITMRFTQSTQRRRDLTPTVRVFWASSAAGMRLLR